jgi:membrane-bound lytic murein transglycosylase D
VTRLVAMLVALGAAGLAAASTTAPPPPPKAPAAHAQAPRPGHEVGRLRALVDAGERAAEDKDWDAASLKAEEADVLVADWPEELLKQPEVAALLARLADLEQHLPETEEVPSVPDPGLKEASAVAALSGAELQNELAQVRSAEVGAVFDFPIDLNDKVLAWVHQFTTSKRGFMERTLSRATMYLPMVRQIFAEERIPQDLAYLAVIESGFINSAHSYAKAVGMWQFMRATGRIYGLGGNAWVEERRDPVKATRAAARYLRRLYETSGDWYLALVGYNAGPGTTDRAIQNLGSRNFWDMHRSRWLRTQTKNYVPELLAAILIGRFPERYGLKVEQLTPYVYETVEIDRMTSLPVLARYAGTDAEALRELNPELLRSTTPPGAYTLRVPPGLSGVTARALARIPVGQRLDFKSYKIRKGETLARLAAKFKLGEDDLLAANDLSKAQFRAGKVIKVPPPPPTPIDSRDLLPKAERAKVVSDQPLESLPGIPAVTAPAEVKEAAPPTAPSRSSVQETAIPDPNATEPPPVVVVKPGPELRPQAEARPAKPAAKARPATHQVKRGETLFAIAVRYGLEVGDLKRWNKLKGNTIQAGQKLRLEK